MRFNILTLSVAGLASAAVMAPMDLPALKVMITTANTALISVDTLIKAITATNTEKAVSDIVAKFGEINKTLIEASSKLKATKPMGLTDLFSLSAPMGTLTTSVNNIVTDTMNKRQFIVKGNQADKLANGLRVLKTGSFALNEAVMKQLPASIQNQIPAGMSLPPAFDKLSEPMFDIAVAIFKDQETMVKIPAGVIPMTPST